MKIAVISSSVRPASVGGPVAEWVAEKANTVEGVQADVVRVADFNLPLFAEDYPTAMRPAQDPAAVTWNETLAAYDGYVIVTPEYNHSIPGALKNALDFISPATLANKAVGLVAYSFSAGHRPIEHLRQILANFSAGVVRDQVNLHLASDFKNMSEFAPADFHDAEVPTMVSSMVTLDGALATLR